jgi:hypothetical protein
VEKGEKIHFVFVRKRREEFRESWEQIKAVAVRENEAKSVLTLLEK